MKSLWRKEADMCIDGDEPIEMFIDDEDGEAILTIAYLPKDEDLVISFDAAATLLETLAEAVEFMASYQAPKEAV